ncbi:MAG: hypothetical protein ACRER5_22635 [Pseudomonas sp.]
MPHVSIRSMVASSEDLYDRFQELYAKQESALALCTFAVVVLLVVALSASGDVAKAAICLTVLAVMNWVWKLSDLVALNWFMHQMTLQDFIQVQDPEVGAIAEALCVIAAQGEAAAQEGER